MALGIVYIDIIIKLLRFTFIFVYMYILLISENAIWMSVFFLSECENECDLKVKNIHDLFKSEREMWICMPTTFA